jgi:hypothetical protein
VARLPWATCLRGAATSARAVLCSLCHCMCEVALPVVRMPFRIRDRLRLGPCSPCAVSAAAPALQLRKVLQNHVILML